jgi:Acetyltransferase (GNAT) domain
MEFARFDQAEGLAQQRELFDDAFPENRGSSIASAEHYRWKFHGAPSQPTSYEYEASENGAMLGYYAAIPYPYQLGERRLVAGMACDVMTHSKARGRGVFTELGRFSVAEMRATELSFLTGYPIRPEVMGGHLRVGWRVAFELPMYLKPLRADAILASRGASWLAPLANLGINAYQATRRSSPRPDLTVDVGDPHELLRTPGFARFLDGWSVGVRNRLLKSADFYDWRLGAPETRYRAFLLRRGKEVIAAAIGSVATLQGIPSLALLDLMMLPGEQAALGTLYRELDSEARREGVEAIVAMISRHRAREYRLARFGFLRSPFKFKLIVHSLDDDVSYEELSAEANWHLMWIDSDDL